MIEQVEAQLQKDGEELKGEDADSKINSLVAKAMAPSKLDSRRGGARSSKSSAAGRGRCRSEQRETMTNLSVLGVIFVTLALIILTIYVVKKIGEPAQDME